MRKNLTEPYGNLIKALYEWILGRYEVNAVISSNTTYFNQFGRWWEKIGADQTG